MSDIEVGTEQVRDFEQSGVFDGVELVIRRELVSCGVAMCVAEAASNAGVRAFREKFGGTFLYVHQGDWTKSKRRVFPWFVSCLRGLLVERGVMQEAAEDAANRCEVTLRRYLGSGYMYLKKETHARLAHRDLDIWNKFNGANFYELAQEYGLSEMRIRQILAAMRTKLKKSSAGDGGGCNGAG